jgi:hypothetical protein
MPIQVDVTNGAITPTGSELTPNTNFEWVNNTSGAVQISNCGNWCSPASCVVPAAANGVPGTYAAQILPMPNTLGGAFSDSAWNPPGMPHIVVEPTLTTPRHEREKEVA